MTYRVAVPTKDCTGVDMEYAGVKLGSYTAKDGVIEVDNYEQAKMIAKMSGAELNMIGTFRNATAPANYCDGCGREHFIAFLENGLCHKCRDKENK